MRQGYTLREQVRDTIKPTSRKRLPKSAPEPVAAPSYPEVFTTIVLAPGRAEGAPTNRSW